MMAKSIRMKNKSINKILMLFFLFYSISCKKDDYKKNYYDNGQLMLKISIDKNGVSNGLFEEFYESGVLKSKGNYLNGIKVDTIYNFNQEGNLLSKGKLEQGKYPSGWWFYYTKNEFLESKIEYIVSNKKSIKNQSIFYNKNGAIDLDKSSYFNLIIPDTLAVGKNHGKIRYKSSYEQEKRRYIFIVIENMYYEDKVIRDTFANDLDTIGFWIFAQKKGKLKVKGELIETILIGPEDFSSLETIQSKKFFSKEVFVKDK